MNQKREYLSKAFLNFVMYLFDKYGGIELSDDEMATLRYFIEELSK